MDVEAITARLAERVTYLDYAIDRAHLARAFLVAVEALHDLSPDSTRMSELCKHHEIAEHVVNALASIGETLGLPKENPNGK